MDGERGRRKRKASERASMNKGEIAKVQCATLTQLKCTFLNQDLACARRKSLSPIKTNRPLLPRPHFFRSHKLSQPFPPHQRWCCCFDMASKAEYKENQDGIVSPTSVPVVDGKSEYTSQDKAEQRDEDLSSVTASEAGPAPPQLFHKPPPKQFVLIMTAYVQSLPA